MLPIHKRPWSVPLILLGLLTICAPVGAEDAASKSLELKLRSRVEPRRAAGGIT